MLFLINPLDLIGVIFALVFMYPWALMLLPRERRSPLALIVVTVALSLGVLTLWMMALALIGALSFGAALGGLALVFAVGQIWVLRTQAVMPGAPQPPLAQRLRTDARQRPLMIGAALVVAGIAGLIVFNALYWPFNDDDAVSIYATQSLRIYQTGELPTGTGLYEAYPMLLPLSHVYSYLVAGEVDEYLARIAVAALGVGTLAAVYVLGRALYDPVTGLAAAVLLALTPAFARWASSGYTDIPAAFFVTLAVLFAWWFFCYGGARNVFALGVMTGLAAWTKNSALALAASMAVWLVVVLWWQRRSNPYPPGPLSPQAEKGGEASPSPRAGRDLGRGKAGRYTPTDRPQLTALLLFGGGLAITAGPWYLRNWIEFGRIVPDTVWTDQAEHTIANLMPFVIERDFFFLPGIVIAVGIVLAIVMALRGRGDERHPAALLLIATIPFAAAWWWAASYEVRFLLAVLPLFAVMGARALVRVAQRIMAGRPALSPAVQLALVLVLIALAVPSARKAVIFKGDLARDPLMSDTRRHQITLGPIYDAARDLKALPAEGHILSDNYFLPFHVNDAGRVEVIVGGLPRRESLAFYDYLVYSSGRPPRHVENADVELLIDKRGYRVFRVLYR